MKKRSKYWNKFDEPVVFTDARRLMRDG